MADTDIPPILVEIWARVGGQQNMHRIGVLNYPFPAPVDEDEFLLYFANQILESRKPGQNAGTGRAS